MAAIDLFASHNEGLSSPASHAAPVTPSDDTDLGYVTRYLWVGGVGDVEVIMLDGTTVVLLAVPSGSLLPIRVSRVKDANTAATSIVAIW
jgi:hypothetical protein